MTIETMPTMGDSQETEEKQPEEEKIKAEYRLNSEQFARKAKTRNKNRSFLKKILNLGEESGGDIAYEEALRVNELVDKMIVQNSSKISAQKLSAEILSSTEFGEKSELLIESIEFLRAKNPNIEEYVRGGFLAHAHVALEELLKKEKIKDDSEKSFFRTVLEKIISDQIDTLVQSENIPEMKIFILKNSLEDLGIKNIAHMPEKVIYSPEIQLKFINKIKQEFGLKAEYPQNAINWKKLFIEVGIMKTETIQKLFDSEEIRNRIEERIKNELSPGDRYKKIALQYLEQYKELGLLTEENIDNLKKSSVCRI
jgi:hypothetical protein